MAFNKMFVMIPLMLAARKLNGEDPTIIFMLRCAYFSVQGVILAIVAYIYIQASTLAATSKGNKVVYVPPPPQPFADPNAKKKYTETTYGLHLISTARSLAGSTMFGMALTVGLHFYKGIVMGLAMQTVMGPLSLLENPLAQYYLMGKNKEKIFEEKTVEELTDDDEVVDAEGKTIVPRRPVKKEIIAKSLEDVLLDTWDLGADADISPLMTMLNKKNIDYKTKENGWTPIMIMSGLGGSESADAVRKMKDMGANLKVVDEEGWNALHWAAFHGRMDAVKVLLDGGGAAEKALCAVLDKEGKDPLEHATAEGNDTIAEFIRNFVNDEVKVLDPNEEGLRRRKKEEEAKES